MSISHKTKFQLHLPLIYTMFSLFLSIQVTQLSTSKYHYSLNKWAKNFSQENPFPFLLKEDSYQAAKILEIHKTTMETIYKLFICINMQPCQTKMLDFNPKHSENNASFLMGRHF